MKRLLNFLRWSWPEKKLFLISLYWITYYWIATCCLPSNKMQYFLGRLATQKSTDIKIDDSNKIKLIRYTIQRAMYFLNMPNKCLIYALSAKKLLNKQQIPSQLYLGVNKEKQKLIAHAWLICGKYNIVGTEEKEKYNVIAVFE